MEGKEPTLHRTQLPLTRVPDSHQSRFIPSFVSARAVPVIGIACLAYPGATALGLDETRGRLPTSISLHTPTGSVLSNRPIDRAPGPRDRAHHLQQPREH